MDSITMYHELKKPSVQIIVAAHKPYRMPEDSVYLPLQVGAYGKKSIGYRRDDEGENISELNASFCELTGLYWAWKNLDDDYLGLVHYRRYFASEKPSRDPWDKILTENELASYLTGIRLFVPVIRNYYIETLYSHYGHTHYASHLDETRKILMYWNAADVPAYDEVLQQRGGYMFNMLVADRNLFGEYCTWLFDILFELRNRIGLETEKKLGTYQGRLYGRVSEILFNTWLRKMVQSGEVKQEEIMELPVIHMEKVDWRKKGTAFLKAKFSGKRYGKSF